MKKVNELLQHSMEYFCNYGSPVNRCRCFIPWKQVHPNAFMDCDCIREELPDDLLTLRDASATLCTKVSKLKEWNNKRLLKMYRCSTSKQRFVSSKEALEVKLKLKEGE